MGQINICNLTLEVAVHNVVNSDPLNFDSGDSFAVHSVFSSKDMYY